MRSARPIGAVVGVLALIGGLAACGGGDGGGSGGDGLSADEERYCELAAEVEAAAEEAFGNLGEDASDEEAAEVQRDLLNEVDDELDEMVEVAPAEIEDDVAAYAGFFRAQLRGEDAEEVSDEEIVAWEEENCPS